MDASVFRFVALELAPRIRGMRIEKVFAPLPDTWTFSLGRAGHLVLCTARTTPFLRLSAHKPDNPHNPSGQAMWLRKRLRDRRVLDLTADWPRRRLAFELSPGEGRYLVLDLSEAPALMDALPEGFGAEPVWPGLERILRDDGLWREHPHLTPPLRHHLRSLPAAAAGTFLEKIEVGDIHVFYHGLDHRGRPQVALWPLEGGGVCTGALEAAEKAFGQALAEKARQHAGVDDAASRNLRRIERALTHVEEDRGRLRKMVEGRRLGLLLQAGLHGLDRNARLGSVTVADEAGEGLDIALDPGLTVRENMGRFFDRAAKGERGLAIVDARAKALRRELEAAREGRVQPVPDAGAGRRAPDASPLPAKYRTLKVQVYRSSDGFLIVRGRNAQANHQLLTKAASPFDYWLHAAGGPGAHVIVKRDFPAQDVPERTVLEAAGLAALASHLKMADRGDVLLCLVRDVRPIKGAALGMVGVDKVLRTVRPAVDPALEGRLRLEERD
jgi:predicted ribosome quality control (RQC) complex YloA/Tae2 family protein